MVVAASRWMCNPYGRTCIPTLTQKIGLEQLRCASRGPYMINEGQEGIATISGNLKMRPTLKPLCLKYDTGGTQVTSACARTTNHN